MENPVNAIYDFKPGAAGQPSTAIPPDELTREDVNIASCNVCHQKLAFHGGSARVETRYCVACHTEQRAYGQAKVTSTATATALAFPALTETEVGQCDHRHHQLHLCADDATSPTAKSRATSRR